MSRQERKRKQDEVGGKAWLRQYLMEILPGIDTSRPQEAHELWETRIPSRRRIHTREVILGTFCCSSICLGDYDATYMNTAPGPADDGERVQMFGDRLDSLFEINDLPMASSGFARLFERMNPVVDDKFLEELSCKSRNERYRAYQRWEIPEVLMEDVDNYLTKIFLPAPREAAFGVERSRRRHEDLDITPEDRTAQRIRQLEQRLVPDLGPVAYDDDDDSVPSLQPFRPRDRPPVITEDEDNVQGPRPRWYDEDEALFENEEFDDEW